MPSRKTALGSAVLLTCIAAAAPPVWAEDDDPAASEGMSGFTIRDPRFANTPVLTDRFSLGIGGYLIDLNTVASAGVGSGIGSVIILEELLGLEPNQTLFRVDGLYRFSPRHSLSFGFFDLHRSSGGEFDEPVDFLGARFVGDFESRFNMLVLGAVYRYSFINDGRVEAGITAGVTAFDFGIGIRGEVTVIPDNPDDSPREEQGSEEHDVLAPVPAVGMFINYAFTPKLVFRAGAQFLTLDVAEWEGWFIDTHITVEYFFSEHVGVGGGFSGTDIRVVYNGEDPFRFEYRYNGILGFLALSF